MLFRIILSDNVNEYYKENATDTQMAMTVEASSFNNAKLMAEARMVSLVFWPNMFEVVSLQKIDRPIEVEDEVNDYWPDEGATIDYSSLNYFDEEPECITQEMYEQAEQEARDRIWGDASDLRKEPVKKASEIWCLDTGIVVLDPDGWNRQDYDNSWYEPITREEFIRRAYMSTCKRWPEPLWDETEDDWSDPTGSSLKYMFEPDEDPYVNQIEDCGDDSGCDEPRCPSYRKYDY